MSEGSYGAHDGVSYGTLDDYHARRSDLADKAQAALSQLRAETILSDPHIYNELLGRLCWLAPDAVLEAVDAARRAPAKPEGNVA